MTYSCFVVRGTILLRPCVCIGCGLCSIICFLHLLLLLLFTPFVIAPFARPVTAVTHNHFLTLLPFLFGRQACLPCWLRELTAFVALFV